MHLCLHQENGAYVLLLALPLHAHVRWPASLKQTKLPCRASRWVSFNLTIARSSCFSGLSVIQSQDCKVIMFVCVWFMLSVAAWCAGEQFWQLPGCHHMSAGRHIKHSLWEHLPCGEKSVPGFRWAQQVLPHVIVWPVHVRSCLGGISHLGNVATGWIKLLMEGRKPQLFWRRCGRCVFCTSQFSHKHTHAIRHPSNAATQPFDVEYKKKSFLHLRIWILLPKSWQTWHCN